MSQDDQRDIISSIGFIQEQTGFGEVTIILKCGVVVEIKTNVSKKKRVKSQLLPSV